MTISFGADNAPALDKATANERKTHRTRFRRSVAVYQAIVPHYRVPIFEELARLLNGELILYAAHYDSLPGGARCVKCRGVTLGKVQFHPRPLVATLLGHHDVIICEGRITLVTSAFLALFARVVGRRVLWWSPMWRPNGTIGIGGGLRAQLLRLILRRLSGFVAYGAEAAAVAARSGVSPDRIFVAHNSLYTPLLLEAEIRWRSSPGRLERFREARGFVGKRVVLYVGQFIRRKRVDVLVDAFSRIRDSDLDSETRLVLVGTGPELQEIRDRVRRLGLEGRVQFEGSVVNVEDLCPYFLCARVVVMPGAGGLVVNHALTHGVPVVVGRGDGTEGEAIVDGENGYRWLGEDVGALATAVRLILDASADHWARLSGEARLTVARKFNSATMLSSMVRAVAHAERGV